MRCEQGKQPVKGGSRDETMPEFRTTCFGSITYQPHAVIEFPLGLPGFEHERRFLLVDQALNKPVVFLQSLSRPELCFMTLPVALICPSYELSLGPEELAALEIEEQPAAAGGSELSSLAIITLAEGRPPTANLLAPIVIHWRRRLAAQVISADSPYSHQHPLFAGTGEAPCS